MYIISDSDIKKMDSLILPTYFKLKIVDKIGIKNIVYNYEELGSKLKHFKETYFMSLVIHYRKKELFNFFTNFEIKDYEDFENLKNVLEYNDYLLNEIVKRLNMKVVNELILTDKLYSSTLEKIYKARKKDIDLLIQDAVKNNDYQKYINYHTPDGIGKIVAENLDIPTIIDIINKNRDYTLIGFIQKYREKDITDYVLANATTQSNLKEYLKLKLPISTYKSIFEKAVIDGDFISIVIKECNDEVVELLYKNYQVKVEHRLDELIEDGTYLDYIKYKKEYLVKYVINKLNDEQLDNLIKDSNLLYYDKIVQAVYKDRRKDVVRIISNNIKNDNLKIVEYLKISIPDEVLTEILNTLTIDNYFLTNVLSSGKREVIGNIYKYYKDEILKIVESDIAKDRTKFLVQYLNNFSYPLVLQKELIKLLTFTEIMEIYESNAYGYLLKDEIYKVYEDEINNEFYKILSTDTYRAIRIIANCTSTDFRSYMVKTLDFDDVFKLLKTLGTTEKDNIYNKYKSKLKDKLLSEYQTDVLKFYIDRISCSDDILSEIAVDLLTTKDIILILEEKYYENGYTTKNKKLQDKIINTIITESNNLKNGSYDECLKFLKALRERNDEYFKLFLANIDLDDEFLHKLFIERGLSDRQKEILYNLKKDDIKRIVIDKINNDEEYAIEYLQKGTPEEILEIALEHISKDKIIELVNDEKFVSRRSIGKRFASKLIIRTYVNKSNIAIVDDLVKSYSKDSFKLIKNFEDIQDFLLSNGINTTKFWQYSLNSSYDFIDDMMTIYKTDLSNFFKVKDFLFRTIYKSDNKYSNNNFLEIIKNYSRYKELCLELANTEDLSNINLKNIRLLFDQKGIIDDIKHISDCDNIINSIRRDYKLKLITCHELDDYKNLILNTLFKNDLKSIKNILENYGTVANLIELKFYNSRNKEILELIDQVITYTSLMEDVIDCEDIEEIKKVCERISNNLDTILVDFNLSNYEELMRELYAKEMDSNLTKIGKNVFENKVLDESKTMKYGVDVYDLHDKQYTLLAHVISRSEEVDNVMNGVASGNYNFISLSAISDRQQSYYYNARGIILGYDNMPLENFVCSSIGNMGTNRAIKKNSTEVDKITRTQRGVSEISDTDSNSEILSLREGMIPKYIICPGREPYQEELELARKYNLKICITQPMDKTINNPFPIKEYSNEEKINLLAMRDSLIGRPKTNERKIAILTDIHGLLEPTIEILESIKRKGIDEIYSLGDNIGTGPNPAEVVDILKQYGVISIKGNHEKYLVDGVDKYKEHLDRTGSYNNQSANTEWTIDKLSKEEIEDIKAYKDSIELTIGGKKILLVHYLNDYNSGEQLYNPEDYDLVIQGHKHFKHKDNNVITLKAAGIGNSDKKDIGYCSYVIITEKENDIELEFVNIPYSYKNTLYQVNKSTIESRVKMKKWIGR